jgi:hypothetical protein
MSVLERDESESEETLRVMRNRSKQVAVWHAPVLRIGISTANYLIRYYVQMRRFCSDDAHRDEILGVAKRN